MNRAFAHFAVYLIALAAGTPAWAFGTGAAGYSNIRAGMNCSSCHASNGAAPTVTLAGPASLTVGTSGDYTLTIVGGPGVRGGMNVALQGAGTLQADGVTTKLVGAELVQAAPLPFAAGTATFKFKLVAPATAGTITLFGAGNSCNGDGNLTGDHAQFSTLAINVGNVPATPPTVAAAAKAAESPVIRSNVVLSVLGADDGGESSLTYTWAATAGPGAVSFSANGSNAAKQTTASFGRAGDYAFTVTIRDGTNDTVTSTVAVTVVSTFSSIAIAPQAITVNPGGSQQFRATAVDQFGIPVVEPQPISFAVSEGGSISANGLFRAGSISGGPHTVTATGGGKSGTSRVTISEPGAPFFADVPTASEVYGKTSRLEALGIDDGGEAGIRYTWAVTGPGQVNLEANGTNAAKSIIATFTQAGTYQVTVTLRDPEGKVATAELELEVEAKLASLEVSPAAVSLNPGDQQIFQATLKDQFGAAMKADGFTWAITEGGSGSPGKIDERGRFKSEAESRGTFTVTASTVGVRGSARVQIGVESPPSSATGGAVGGGLEVTGGCASTGAPPLGADVLIVALLPLLLRRRRIGRSGSKFFMA